MEKCKDCKNYISGKCKRYKVIGGAAYYCDWYNADLPDGILCLNCEHFLGGMDWGMACAKRYSALPTATTPACKKFEDISL